MFLQGVFNPALKIDINTTETEEPIRILGTYDNSSKSSRIHILYSDRLVVMPLTEKDCQKIIYKDHDFIEFFCVNENCGVYNNNIYKLDGENIIINGIAYNSSDLSKNNKKILSVSGDGIPKNNSIIIYTNLIYLRKIDFVDS